MPILCYNDYFRLLCIFEAITDPKLLILFYALKPIIYYYDFYPIMSSRDYYAYFMLLYLFKDIMPIRAYYDYFMLSCLLKAIMLSLCYFTRLFYVDMCIWVFEFFFLHFFICNCASIFKMSFHLTCFSLRFINSFCTKLKTNSLTHKRLEIYVFIIFVKLKPPRNSYITLK